MNKIMKSPVATFIFLTSATFIQTEVLIKQTFFLLTCFSFQEAALTSLKSLNRNDVVEVLNDPQFTQVKPTGCQINLKGLLLTTLINADVLLQFHDKISTQVRALQRPPPGVKLVIDAVCIIKGVKPKKVAGEKVY